MSISPYAVTPHKLMLVKMMVRGTLYQAFLLNSCTLFQRALENLLNMSIDGITFNLNGVNYTMVNSLVNKKMYTRIKKRQFVLVTMSQ